MRVSSHAASQRPSRRRHPSVSISPFRSRATLKACYVRARGLPVFFRSAALPAYQRPGLPRAALAAGKSTDSSCGCASPWLHQDVGIRQFVGYARSRSHQPCALPPPKPFWRAPADCLWLSASRTPPEGWIQGNKKPGAVAGFRCGRALEVSCAVWEKYIEFPTMATYLCRIL